jgi:hypothetical protein
VDWVLEVWLDDESAEVHLGIISFLHRHRGSRDLLLARL